MASIAFEPIGMIRSFLPLPFARISDSLKSRSLISIDVSSDTLSPEEYRSSRIALSLVALNVSPLGLSNRVNISSMVRKRGRFFGTFGLDTSLAGFLFTYPSLCRYLKNDLIVASFLAIEVFFSFLWCRNARKLRISRLSILLGFLSMNERNSLKSFE